MSTTAYHGIVVIDKPAGITSRAAINQLQKCLPKGTRIGHAGTLDPMATGVLVVAIGRATRLIEYVQRMEKTYKATFYLGASSTTDDADGDVTRVDVAVPPTLEEVDRGIRHFEGVIDQVPPAFSAAKIAGRRAYQLARRGAEVELAPRKVFIRKIELQKYEYPHLRLIIHCGSGTYIRSLARDLGHLLGSGAYVAQLRRTRVGVFTVDMVRPRIDDTTMLQDLLPESLALEELPKVEISVNLEKLFRQGQQIPLQELVNGPGQIEHDAEVAVFREDQLIGVARVTKGGTMLAPVKVLAQGM